MSAKNDDGTSKHTIQQHKMISTKTPSTMKLSTPDSYKYSFFPRTISEWNKLSQDVRSKPSVASFRSAPLKVPEPVEINF